LELDKIYTESFFARRKSLIWRAEILCDIIAKEFDFDSIIDVGCAIGEYVQRFNQLGYIAKGIEGSTAAIPYLLDPENISITDIAKIDVFSSGGLFDICMCLEVAEHISEKYTDTFIRNLCRLSQNILFSAAEPGQKGHGHINCQPKSYWEHEFVKRNYCRDCDKEEAFKTALEPYKRKKGLSGYYGNLMIFIKSNEKLPL
jgi:hypothetical protein